MKVLVTGITGFIGSAVARGLKSDGWDVVGQSHTNHSSMFPSTRLTITSKSDWSDLLRETDLVVHCAAFNTHNGKGGSLSDYLETNTFGTIELAKQAALNGVKRFIYISSVKVNGETTRDGVPFNQDSIVSPENYYALSKARAEDALFASDVMNDMDVVVVRPPLVYGPGVNSNFTTMMKLVHTRLPLPFGSLSNKRSLIFIDNLVDFIISLSKHNNISGNVFFISDGHDVSTTELLYTIGSAMNINMHLLPIPSCFLNIIFRLFGKSNIGDKLFSSLQVDIERTKDTLGWYPPVTFEDGVKLTVEDYLKRIGD